MAVTNRLKKVFNIFNRNESLYVPYSFYSGVRDPSHTRLIASNLKTIVSSVYNQIAVDVSSANICHARLNDDNQYIETIKGPLNRALTLEANIDQTGRELIKDAVISMLDEGCVTIVPIITDDDPELTDAYKIYTLRVGKIVSWYSDSILVDLFNEERQCRQQVLVKKSSCAIIENPFYEMMNEANSTAKRLARILDQLEDINGYQASGRLDLVVQLPYTVKNPVKREYADDRRRDIEEQLVKNKYGIAYVDGTEKIIQLNRPIENNLLEQAEKMTIQLLNQLGYTQSIFDGTADEQTMLNYHNRTISPILRSLTENMTRKWISPTAYTQGQAIWAYKDPFAFSPTNQLIEAIETCTRNEVMSSNEGRSILGLKPSADPKADELHNSNLNRTNENATVPSFQNQEYNLDNIG